MIKKSVAHRNVLILLFSLLPFLLGIGYSVAKSSSMDYFGAAINISGSQRMRTMLIANYAQQLEDAYLENDQEKLVEVSKILESEVITYEKFMSALLVGSEELDLVENRYPDIRNKINSYKLEYGNYVKDTKALIENPDQLHLVDLIVAEALPLKNNIHMVVEMYQEQYDNELRLLKSVDMIMIGIAIIVTTLGLTLTRAIKRHEFFANYDHLTGLLTRYNLYENIKKKDPNNYDIYFIDLNKFKYINDTFGHSIGDEILIEVSKRLIDVFGLHNVYRYGGDEFIVLLKNSEKTVERLSMELKNKILAPITDTKYREHYIGLSLGAVAKGVGPKEWDQLIHFADELMYDAKSYAGHIILCQTKEEAYNKLNLDVSVAEGLKKGEFTHRFQSIYNVSNQDIEIQMVLCRWERGPDKIIKPSEFLPILKRKGLLDTFDIYMISHLDSLYSKMNETEKNYTYSVNITEETLLSARYNGLIDTLKSISIPKEKLILKFMEDVLVNDDVLSTLELLSDLGYTLAVDNFTIDISLKESSKYKNISIVKLGKAIVSSLMIDEYSKVMLKEFIKMLVSINKTVIIEGIEAPDEVEVLKNINNSISEDLYYSTPYKLRTIEELHRINI